MHHHGRSVSCACGGGQESGRCCAAREAQGPVALDADIHRDPEQLAGELLRYARQRFGEAWLREAIEAFFELLEVEPEDSQLFVPWLVHHWPVEGRPVREWFLEERGATLAPGERERLEAQRSVVVSVWEVRRVHEGVGVAVRDLLRGEERFVREVLGSLQLEPGDAVLGRVVEHAGRSEFCGLYPMALPPRWAAEVVREARRVLKARGRKPVPHAKLEDPDATLCLVHAWQDAELGWMEDLALAEGPPTLLNRDGEPLLLTVDHFELVPEDRARVLAGLERVEGAELEEEGVPASFSFVRGDDGIVGRAEVREASVLVETNSVARADALRSRVEAACAGLLRFRLREHTDPVALMEKMEAAGRAPGVEEY